MSNTTTIAFLSSDQKDDSRYAVYLNYHGSLPLYSGLNKTVAPNSFLL